MRKYYVWIIVIPIVLLIACCIILINIPSRSLFDGVNIENTFNLKKVDLELLKIDDFNEVEPIRLIKCDDREDIKFFKFKTYYIYLTSMKVKLHYDFDSVFIFDDSINKTNFKRYYNYKFDNNELSIGVEKLEYLSSVYISGNVKSFNHKEINRNLHSWYGSSDNVGLKYNYKNSFTDLYFQSNSSVPINIVIYEQSSHVYLMFIISTPSNIKGDTTNIEQDILSAEIIQNKNSGSSDW